MASQVAHIGAFQAPSAAADLELQATDAEMRLESRIPATPAFETRSSEIARVTPARNAAGGAAPARAPGSVSTLYDFALA